MTMVRLLKTRLFSISLSLAIVSSAAQHLSGDGKLRFELPIQRKIVKNKRGISNEMVEKVVLGEILRFESPVQRTIDNNERGISKNTAEKSVFEELMLLKIKELTEKRKQTRYS